MDAGEVREQQLSVASDQEARAVRAPNLAVSISIIPAFRACQTIEF